MFNINSTDFWRYLAKAIIYLVLALAAALGVTGLVTSCSITKDSSSFGRTHVVITDTTIIEHSGAFNLSVK